MALYVCKSNWLCIETNYTPTAAWNETKMRRVMARDVCCAHVIDKRQPKGPRRSVDCVWTTKVSEWRHGFAESMPASGKSWLFKHKVASDMRHLGLVLACGWASSCRLGDPYLARYLVYPWTHGKTSAAGRSLALAERITVRGSNRICKKPCRN